MKRNILKEILLDALKFGLVIRKLAVLALLIAYVFSSEKRANVFAFFLMIAIALLILYLVKCVACEILADWWDGVKRRAANQNKDHEK